MSTILYDEIPSVDLADFTSGDAERRAAFVKQIGEAFENIGFVAVKNHGLTDEAQGKLYEAVQQFFSLPSEVKAKYERPETNHQRGFIGPNKETAKGFKVPDMKEFIHVGQELTAEERASDAELSEYPENVWYEEVPQFKELGLHTFRTLEKAANQLLRAIALHLDLEEDYFEDKVKHGNSILRAIHYYAVEDPNSVPEGAVRAAAHGDINLITLLMGASAEGLQVLRKDEKWIPVTALPDQLVVNIGDMLSRLTNNRLKSTIHRVVNPPKEKLNTPRFSIPFFMHPRSAMNLSCLPTCVREENPKQFEDITAGEYLHERLVELGLVEAKK